MARIIISLLFFFSTTALGQNKGNLENPAQDSYMSGIYLFSGWACDAELIEIKPKAQSIITEKVQNARQQAVVAINHAKWHSAKAFCKAQGIKFRVVTEDDLFYNGRGK